MTETLAKKAEQLQKVVAEIVHHFQTVNAAANETVENLSIQETKAITLIGQKEQCIMREIADNLNVAVSTVTGLVDKLEEKKLVKRERSDADRRIINIVLTAKGQEIYQFQLEEFMRLCRGMLLGMSEKEQDMYIELSKKIAANARENFSGNGNGSNN